MPALIVGRLKMPLLDLETGLAEHRGAFNVPKDYGKVERVLPLVCLHIELEVHCSLDKREKNGG